MLPTKCDRLFVYLWQLTTRVFLPFTGAACPSTFKTPFGITINFVPLTPGIRPRAEPAPSSSFPDLDPFKLITDEELAEMRRNMEILLLASNDQWMETTHRSQSDPQFDSQFVLGATYPTEEPMVEESHFGFVEGYDPQAMPTNELPSFDIDPAQLSELQQLCASTFPNGVPEETDTWTMLSELTEIATQDSTSAAAWDESFFRTFQSVDDLGQHFDMTNPAYSIHHPDMTDITVPMQ